MNETERRAVHELLRRRAAERADTQAKARSWLVEEGIHDDDGRLTPQYGGESGERRDDR